MEELQAQIDTLKLEIEQLKSRCANAFCIDEVKMYETLVQVYTEAAKKAKDKQTDCCNPICRP